ncbi:hypothetical protein ZWY2020_019712 [Hordeum vulgare]|nr:hypothetical protein ZWY2020_019712 [Hordeum vulgare]
MASLAPPIQIGSAELQRVIPLYLPPTQKRRKKNMAARAGAFLMVVCLVLATAAAVSGARPIAMPEEGGAARATVESPAGDAIQTMVRAVERRFMFDVGMLRGIKNSGPSPGDGH